MLYNKRAFTLAEVLITLGIIGVVAAMTIPTLMKNHQKKTAITRLKVSYSKLTQALQLSVAQNGEISEWTFPTSTSNYEQTKAWVDTYVKPYMRMSETKSQNCWSGDNVLRTGAISKIADGSSMCFWYNGNGQDKYMHVWIKLNDGPNWTEGKDSFLYVIGTYPKNGYYFDIGCGGLLCVYSYRLSPSYELTRDRLLNDQRFGCKTSGLYCSTLIWFDGWKIKDDYPYFK